MVVVVATLNEIKLVRNMELPTLSMVNFDSNEPDYALVKKLGTRVKRKSAASRQSPGQEP